MKIPKLKYYYFAMNPAEYSDFESNRSILVSSGSIDPVTGRVFARPNLLLLGSASLADTQFRINTDYRGPVYVLRIPAHCVDRSKLVSAGPNAWHYGRSITVDHCGVDRFDLDMAAA